MRIYETIPEEVEEVLSFRNAIFNDISRSHWESMECTAVVAREGDRLLGFIPLQYRQQCLNGRVSIPVVYENAVGVAEGMRGRGIGSRMLDAAAQFIRNRAHAMMVIRGGEQSIGYRFYRKTGHGDLMYARTYTAQAVPSDQDCSEGISVLNESEWIALEPQLLALYDRKYGYFGGGRRREKGYWQTILKGHVYRDRPWHLVVLKALNTPAQVRGYMVAVTGGTWQASEDVYIYEVVGEDDEAVRHLVNYATVLACSHISSVSNHQNSSRQVIVPSLSLANPAGRILENLGFVSQSTTPHILTRILRPEPIWMALAADSDLQSSLSLTVCTPHRSLVVHDPPDARYTAVLETKESLFSRLFCCRLDLKAAMRMELVRWNGDKGIADQLCQIFAFSDWVQWYTDYI